LAFPANSLVDYVFFTTVYLKEERWRIPIR
jgi:hypothetical protein